MNFGNVAIARGGKAIGDMIQTTPVLRCLDEAGANVIHVWADRKTWPILDYNPHVDNVFDLDGPGPEEMPDPYDTVIALGNLIERHCFFKTHEDFPLIEERRKVARGFNYYDALVDWCGIQDARRPFLPEFFWSREEDDAAAKWRFEKGRKRWIVWNPVGTKECTRWYLVYAAIRIVHERFKNTEHFLVGDFNTVFDHETDRVHPICTSWPIRKVINLLRVADVFVGCDSALANAAGAMPDLAKVIYYTHSAPENLGRDFTRHYPVQSAAVCSPCYLLPVNWQGTYDLEKRERARETALGCTMRHHEDHYIMMGYKCVNALREERIVEHIVKAIRGKA
jgi:ADP-heptose:LPS heptosyltransferase